MGLFKVRKGYVYFQALPNKMTVRHPEGTELNLSETELKSDGQDHKLEPVGVQPSADERPEVVAHGMTEPPAERGEGPPKRRRGQRGPSRIHAGE